MALIRSIASGARAIRVAGIPNYGGANGGPEIVRSILEHKPDIVFMESFAVGTDLEVHPGDVIPYRKYLHPQGLLRATQLVDAADFQQSWTAESLAVLAALRIGAEIHLADRLHVTSFDRLLARRTFADLRNELVNATENLAATVQQEASKLASPGLPEMPQNALCPLFEELSRERHLVMAHFAQQSSSKNTDVFMVLGAEHAGGVSELLEAGMESAEPELRARVVEELLQSEPLTGLEEASWEEQLMKRILMGAFLASTRTFPSDVVLPPEEQLHPDAYEVVKKNYPKYRQAFGGRMAQALTGSASPSAEQVQALVQQRSSTSGLLQLPDLCNQFAAGQE